MGIASACTGVGSTYPSSSTARSNSGIKPSESNDIFLTNLQHKKHVLPVTPISPAYYAINV
jgi:hypothetical protein